MTNDELIESYRRRYGKAPRLFYAPGRINLIGEHTDYNEGFVLPFAIDSGATVAAAPRPGRRFLVHSHTLNDSFEFDLDDPPRARRGVWLDYVEGMCRSLEGFGVPLTGADLLITSDVPLGAGLSSSAALEVSVGLAVCGVSGQPADPLTIVRAAHQAETKFVGTQSGIMDQYVSVFAQARACLLLDCRHLTSRSLRWPANDMAIVICDSGTKRALATSAYNQRREECRQGVLLIRKRLDGVTALRDVSSADFALLEDTLPEPIRRRCRHVITENERTLAAAAALELRDFVTLGRLMSQSHESLRFDYAVSVGELDLLADTALTVPGVLGSRMTGGGFGGCTITLLEGHAIDSFVDTVRNAFQKQFSRLPRFFLPVPSAGAHEILV